MPLAHTCFPSRAQDGQPECGSWHPCKCWEDVAACLSSVTQETEQAASVEKEKNNEEGAPYVDTHVHDVSKHI